MFSYEYCKIFKNTYVEEHLPMAASVWRRQNPREVFLSGYLNVSAEFIWTEYIWIFNVFKMGIFIEKKIFALRIQFSEAVVRRCSSKIDRCSWKFRKFLRQTVTSESLINKVAGLQAFRPAVSFKKRLRHRCFSVKLGKFFQHLFIQWHSRWLLLSFNRFYSSTRLSDSAWRSGQVII